MNQTLAEPIVRVYRMFPARADILPYGEAILPGLWQRLHDEGTFEMFFHDVPDLTFGQFVNALSRPEEQVHVVGLMDGPGEDAKILDTAAIAMLTDIRVTDKVKRGLGNFILMRDFWAHADAARIGSVILDAWFRELTVIAGLTPQTNERALRYVQHMGFQITGMLPQFTSYRGQVCDAVVTAQTRREWMARREELSGLDG